MRLGLVDGEGKLYSTEHPIPKENYQSDPNQVLMIKKDNVDRLFIWTSVGNEPNSLELKRGHGKGVLKLKNKFNDWWLEFLISGGIEINGRREWHVQRLLLWVWLVQTQVPDRGGSSRQESWRPWRGLDGGGEHWRGSWRGGRHCSERTKTGFTKKCDFYSSLIHSFQFNVHS